VQLTVDQKPDINWEFNPASAARVAGDTTHPELAADADLAGCPVIVEGRKDVSKHEHHIWILVPGDKQYLDSDGIFRAREFSAWAYPTNWNLDDFSTTKPPVAAEFIDGKRNNQQTNGYDWPIFVHQSTGNTLEFKPGTKIGAPLPNNCDFAEPSHLNVTGVYDSSAKTFDASIGAEGCWTAAYDGNANGGVWTDWQGAKDNYIIHYPTKFEAWLFPSTYTEMDVTAWEIKHIVGQP
jgi:hypothetical protein